MTDESTLGGEPARRWIRRRWIRAGMLAGVLALGGLLFGIPNGEPRYRGKTSSQWFPYFWDFSKGPIPGAALTNGAPESFPGLWSSLREETPKWVELYEALVNELSVKWKTPRGRNFYDVQAEMKLAVLRSAASRPFANLVVSNWMELPDLKRRYLLHGLVNDVRLVPIAPDVVANLESVVSPLLSTEDPECQWLAASLLLHLPKLQTEQLRRIARVALAFPSGSWRENQFWPRLYRYRGAGMPGRRGVAEVLAERPELHGDPFRLRLCLLDPERYPASGYWEPSGDLQRDLTRRLAVGEAIHFLADGHLDEFAP